MCGIRRFLFFEGLRSFQKAFRGVRESPEIVCEVCVHDVLLGQS